MLRAGFRSLSSSCSRGGYGPRRRSFCTLPGYSDALLHVSALRDMLGRDSVQTSEIDKYTRDWTGHYSGGSVVAFPSSVEEVSNVMKYCHANQVGVVVQGGNTGLVGGAVGLDNELIISTAKMNTIYEVDETAGVLICDAGVILEEANNHVQEHGFMMPIDLGAKASCMIGGNVSTNAGGLRVIKYGSFHANVVGLECVLADGTVMDMLRTVQKDNCGYHLKHLFIGSEGTLGVVTKIALKLYPLPSYTVVAIAKLPSFTEVSKLLRSARGALGETLSAFEYMDRKSITALEDQYPHMVEKFSNSLFRNYSLVDKNGEDNAFVLLEASGSDSSLTDRVNQFLSTQLEANIVLDAVLAQDGQQEAELWKIREFIPVALAQMSRNTTVSGPFLFKYDISLPWLETERLVTAVEEYMSGQCGHAIIGFGVGVDTHSSRQYLQEFKSSVDYVVCTYCYGHAGDQNLHLNVILRLQEDISDNRKRQIKQSVKTDLEHAVLTETMKLNGSISAEHGMGQQKSHLLHQARNGAEVQMMKLIKTSLDPKCILNPGKVIPFPGTSCK